MAIADIEHAIAEKKRKRDVDNAATQQAEPKAKQRSDGTDEARERQTDVQAKGKDAAMPSDKVTVPAKEKQRRKESCANTFVRIAGNP